MIGKQHSWSVGMLLDLLNDVANRLTRASRSPGSYGDDIGNAETQKRLIGAGQRLVGDGKAGDVRRVSMDHRSYISTHTVDACMHSDDLTGGRWQVAFYHLAIKGHGSYLHNRGSLT